MKKFATTLLFGKDARLNGLIAFAIVGAIALGCTCTKNLGDFGKKEEVTNTASNSTSPPTPDRPSKPDASTGDVPSEPQSQELARATILDFNDAIQSGDFSDFHRTISKPFQRQASPEKMEDAFKAFIEAKVDLSEVRTLTANFSPSPSIQTTRGVKNLQIKGNYATSPRRMNFDLKYIPEGSDWKLIAIEINTKN